jgi:dTDP-4-amino-4,6-dideoxygalactose transaminase
MRVPFVDLRAQHDEVREAIDAAICSAIDESAFIGGRRVQSFEAAFANYLGSGHAIGMSNGTDALELALRAIGVGAGDVVVTVPNTFIATAEAALQLGAIPRFVDVDPDTHNLDPALLADYFTADCQRDSGGVLRDRATGGRVAAVLPVHLYGLPADLNAIQPLAAQYGVAVVEDACQAHGAEIRRPDGRWVKAGTLGRVGCFSFYPGKNLGALGDAGAAVTNDVELDRLLRLYHEHGQSERYVHVSPAGVNARLDAIQAAVLEIKLAKLDEWNAKRRQIARWYAEDLAGTGLPLPVEPAGLRHVYHLYVVRAPQRDRVRQELQRRGIDTGLHYPIPIHLQAAMASSGYQRGSFPISERDADEVISLPMYPLLSREQVGYVAQQLARVVG